MKCKKLKLSAILLLGLGLTGLDAQNLDRVALSSGGIASDTLNATIGEIFVFSVNGSGINLDAGSQSDQSNTGGIVTTAIQIEKAPTEILVYPNPVQDFLNLQIYGINSETVSFQVYDSGGKLIMQQNNLGANNLYQIQVKQLPQGNYFIHGYTPKGKTIGKINFIKL